MKRVGIFLMLLLIGLSYASVLDFRGHLPEWILAHHLLFRCVVLAGFGGVVYCARAIYVHVSDEKDWDEVWLPWYFIRPILSLVCGATSYLFLKAGLLALNASTTADPSNIGFLALAFIAGLNVDRFLQKVEELAEATWGIEKSNASQGKVNMRTRKRK